MKKAILTGLVLVAIVVAGFFLRDMPAVSMAVEKITQSTGLAAEKPAAPAAAGQPARAAGGSRGKSPVEVAKAQATTLREDVLAIGTLLPRETVAIAPETSGRIAEINFEDGARVEQGQILFRLDKDIAGAAVEDAKARLELAQSNFNRNQTLLRSRNVAQATFDAASAELSAAKSALEVAEVQLRKLDILVPFSGTLGFRAVSLGAYVTPGTALVQLEKVDRLYVSFSVPELQLRHVRVGQQVDVAADALPGQVFGALITGVEPSVDVAGRALKVRAEMDNAKLLLRPGLLVRVTVKGEPRESIIVPEAAILQRGDNALVFVVVDGKAKATPVTTGLRKPGEVEITSGLAAGADVVVAGNTRLQDGAEVDVVPPPAQAD
ncbi:MAG: efflux RND transporter periplasmic adaptor subunit [Proteobacteria bacterium]|nr:efflux RND transporter periplasmic adaptor subunit [Pseudomonadota bacterium]